MVNNVGLTFISQIKRKEKQVKLLFILLTFQRKKYEGLVINENSDDP